jgi:hypothetical protein
MFRTLQRLIICALLIAVPLQGITATAMLLCSPNVHNPHQSSVHGDQLDTQAAAVNAAGTSSDHHSSMNSTSQCSACSLCCNLLAIPPSMLAMNPSTEPQHYPTLNVSAPFGPIIEGPKRPPRGLQA